MLQHYGTILCLEKAPLGGWWEDALRHLLRLRGGESWSLELHWYWWMADFMWTIGRSQEMHAVEGSNFDRLAIHLNELFQVLLFAKVMRDPDNGTQPWKMSAMSVVFGRAATWRGRPFESLFQSTLWEAPRVASASFPMTPSKPPTRHWPAWTGVEPQPPFYFYFTGM